MTGQYFPTGREESTDPGQSHLSFIFMLFCFTCFGLESTSQHFAQKLC